MMNKYCGLIPIDRPTSIRSGCPNEAISPTNCQTLSRLLDTSPAPRSLGHAGEFSALDGSFQGCRLLGAFVPLLQTASVAKCDHSQAVG